MSVQKAIKLLQSIDNRDVLRRQMYACKSIVELDDLLKVNNIWFQSHEFEEALNMLHVKCQTKEEANELFLKAEWYNFLVASVQCS